MGISIGGFTKQACDVLDKIPCGEYTIDMPTTLQDGMKDFIKGKKEIKNGE